MTDSIKSFMRVGIVHPMAFFGMNTPKQLLQSVEVIAQDPFFEVIECTHVPDAAVRRELVKICETAHLAICFVSQPMLFSGKLNLNDADEGKRLAAVDKVLAYIDEAYEMGCETFLFAAGQYEAGDEENALRRLIASSDTLCTYAQQKGDMKVALEVFDYNLDKKLLIGPAELARRFAAEVCGKHKNFGLATDMSHIPQLHETVDQSILPVKEYITHTHMGNCVTLPGAPAFGDNHPRFMFPNSDVGVEELAEYLRKLIEIGYLSRGKRGIVSLEVKPFGDEKSELVIANAKRIVEAAWTIV